MSALLGILVILGVPGAALAEGTQIKLSLLAVDQPKAYFDLTMRPGETRSLDVEIANDGQAPIVARTYAADVYTIVNGGFGGRLHGEPQTGTTRWLDYPSAVLQLSIGKSVRQAFTVAVPAGTGPGEYITSVVLENDQPIVGGGQVALNQVVRQAVGVVVTVPGLRSPALAIGGASHSVVAGKSVVAIVVENTGNVRLKPVAEFALFDETGARVSHATVPMDTFYARTSTLVEVPLAALLLPGTYTARLTVVDALQGVGTDRTDIRFVVAAPAQVAVTDGGAPPALAKVTQGAPGQQITVSLQAVLAVLGLLLASAFACVVFMLWRRRSAATSSR